MGPGAVGPGARLCLHAAPRGPAAAARPALNCTRKRTEGGREEADKAKGHGPNLSKQQPGAAGLQGRAGAAPGLGRARSGLEESQSSASPRAPLRAAHGRLRAGLGGCRGARRSCAVLPSPLTSFILSPSPPQPLPPGTNGDQLRVTVLLHLPVLGARFPPFLPQTPPRTTPGRPQPLSRSLTPTSAGQDPQTRGGSRGPCGVWGCWRWGNAAASPAVAPPLRAGSGERRRCTAGPGGADVTERRRGAAGGTGAGGGTWGGGGSSPLSLSAPSTFGCRFPAAKALRSPRGGTGCARWWPCRWGQTAAPWPPTPQHVCTPKKSLYLSQLCLVFSPQGSALQLGRVLGLELASSPRTGALRGAHGATPAPRPRWGGAMPPGALHLKKAVPPLSTFTPSALFPLRAVGLQYFYRPGRFPVCNPRAHGCGRSDRGAGCPAPAPILPAPGHPSRGRGTETPSAVTLQGLSQLLSAAGRAGTAWGGSSRDRGSRGARSFALPAAFPQPLPSGSRIPGKKGDLGEKKNPPHGWVAGGRLELRREVVRSTAWSRPTGGRRPRSWAEVRGPGEVGSR